MDNGAIKLMEREMIRQVALKGIPVTWNLSLKRSNKHNYTTLADLQKFLNRPKKQKKKKKKMLTKRKGSTEITHLKTKDKVVTKEVMKDKSLDINLVERRDTTTIGNITRTTYLVPITRATRVIQTTVYLQGEDMN